jgi:hypothetical protein
VSRFFFDVATKRYVQYDYRGVMLKNVADAHQVAELIALDLSCSDIPDISEHDRRVEVRDAAGNQLFSVPLARSAAA